jgi:hypothetical protein
MQFPMATVKKNALYIFLKLQIVGGFRSIIEKYNELFRCYDVFFHAGCETDKRQNNNLI